MGCAPTCVGARPTGEIFSSYGRKRIREKQPKKNPALPGQAADKVLAITGGDFL